MTAEHLRPLFATFMTMLGSGVSLKICRSFVLEEIVKVIRLGRFTALHNDLEAVGALCALTPSVASSRRPLHNNSKRWFRVPRHLFKSLCQQRKALSVSFMILLLSQIWMNAPQCCRSMASALSTSFLVCRCWKAYVPLKVVIRSFRLCCNATATHFLIFGRKLKAR